MAFHVRDPETDRIVRALAARTGKSLTDTIRDACARELEETPAERLARFERVIAPLQARVAANRVPGAVADKAFYDSLSDD